MLDRKIRYCSLPEAIREHFLWGARSIVIAGTHGKTTTTSLTGWLLTHGGADPSVLVGGIARNFGEHGSSYRMGQGRDFVIEGDEYDSAFFDKTAKFLKYLPDIAVDQQRRVRSRGHLRRPRRGAPGVPAARQPRAAARACCCSAPTARRRLRCASARSRASRRSAPPTAPTGRRTISGRPAARHTFRVRRRGDAVRRVRGAAARRAQRAQRAGGDRRRDRGRRRSRTHSRRR